MSSDAYVNGQEIKEIVVGSGSNFAAFCGGRGYTSNLTVQGADAQRAQFKTRTTVANAYFSSCGRNENDAQIICDGDGIEGSGILMRDTGNNASGVFFNGWK